MFCGNCGAQNPDGATFCAQCGAPLSNQQTTSPVGSTAVAANKNKIIGMAAVGVVALVVLIVIISIFSGRGANSTAEKLMTATFKGDGEGIVELIPDGVIEAYGDQRNLSSKDARSALAVYFENTFKGASGIANTGDIKVSADAVGDKEYSASQKQSIVNDYKNIGVNIKDAKLVLVDVTIKYGGEELETKKPIEVPLVKVGGSWYVDFDNMNSAFALSIVSAFLG